MSSSSWWSTKHSLMQIPTWIISFFLATNWVVVITHTFSLVCGWNSNLTHNSQLFIWKPVQMSSTWFDTSLNSTHKYIWKKVNSQVVRGESNNWTSNVVIEIETISQSKMELNDFESFLHYFWIECGQIKM